MDDFKVPSIHLFFLLLTFLWSCSHDRANEVPSPRPIESKVEIKTDSFGANYSLTQGECRVSVGIYPPESVNKNVASLRQQGCHDEALVSKQLEQILLKLASDFKGNLPFHSLSLGRLEEYPSFSQALKAFANDSPDWNIKKGKPIKGNENNFVTAALNQLRPSLWVTKILKPYWKDLRIPWVEKVLVDPVSKLPFDCQLWISAK